MTAIKRPNKFVSLSKSPMMGGFDASSDGDKMIIAMAMANAYSETSSPKDFNELLAMEGAEQQNSMMLVSQDPVADGGTLSVQRLADRLPAQAG